MLKNKKAGCHKTGQPGFKEFAYQISERMNSGLLSLEFFLDLLNINTFEDRLEILNLQSLSSLCGYRFILTVFAL